MDYEKVSNYQLTKDEYELIDKITDRALKEHLYDEYSNPRLTAYMDLNNAHKFWELRLEDMLHSDILDFAHDIVMIKNTVIRAGKLGPGFDDDEGTCLPRFAIRKR